MKKGLDGFVLATFEAAIGRLDFVKIPPTNTAYNQNLMEFESPTTTPRQGTKNTIPSEYLPTDPNLEQFASLSMSSNGESTTPKQTRPDTQPTQQKSDEPKFETLKKAEKAYVRALKQIQTVDSFNQLAVYYNTRGKYAKAILYCNQALALDPNNDTAKQNLAFYTKKSSYG